MEAVDEVDQMGNQPDPMERDEQGGAALGGEPMMGPGIGIMEQWLDQVEGDPSFLMRNQFMIEEAQYMRSRGGAIRETRPW
jgi:Ca-activated chloride channel family protein